MFERKNVDVVVIAGPTAVGKTEIGIELAEMVSGEIISADSRQFYKYMDVGTAKPTLRQKSRVPHHLIDIREPDKPVSAGEFRDLSLECIRKILKRNRLPILAGGAGLYIRALLHGIFPESKTDDLIRKRLQKELREKGSVFLYNQLLEIDPEYAFKIHINDGKRITRALEIFEITGKPPSLHFKKQSNDFPYRYISFFITMERSRLYERINVRVEQMIKDGLLEEVEYLFRKGYRKSLKELNTLGYQEAIEYLEGKVSLEEMVENLKKNTRRYAKRQITWFRNQENCVQIERGGDESEKSVALRILEYMENYT